MLFFDNKDLTNVLLTARMQGGQLHLAKDEGVYLMPATGAWQGNDPVPRIAYAAGCHPQKMRTGTTRHACLPAAMISLNHCR